MLWPLQRHDPASVASLAPATVQIPPRNDPGTCPTSQILPRSNPGTCSTSQILSQVTIRNTLKGLIRISDPGHITIRNTVRGLIRMNDPAHIHGCNATIDHVTGSGAARKRSIPHTNQDKRTNPHIDRFHIPIRINDPAHITIDSTNQSG